MARVAIVSDIHSNLAALDAVIDDVGYADDWWCTGDVIGYGPFPNQCIQRLQALGARCILGNHDHGAMHLADLPWFNSTAGEALAWTAEQLDAASWDWLRSIPETRTEGDYWLVHGSPRDHLLEYVLSAEVASEGFRHMPGSRCLIGHTHIPSSFVSAGSHGDVAVSHQAPDSTLTLTERPSIVNAGSVGQPRDGDPRAAYGLLDTETHAFVWRRVAYDVERTQTAMRATPLPRSLSARLAEGR